MPDGGPLAHAAVLKSGHMLVSFLIALILLGRPLL